MRYTHNTPSPRRLICISSLQLNSWQSAVRFDSTPSNTLLVAFEGFINISTNGEGNILLTTHYSLVSQILFLDA